MSENEESLESSIPFGFTFVNEDRHVQQQQSPQRQQTQGESHQPSGPPLLDNNETGLLRDFFDNPHNIDPGFLASAQGRQQEYDPYATSHQQQWFMPQEPGQEGAQSQQTSPVQPFEQRQSPTDDVYAAARLLQGSNQAAYSNGGISNHPYPGVTHAPQTPIFGYPQPSRSGFAGPGMGPQQASPTEPHIFADPIPEARATSGRRPTPLNFGSDNKFRGMKYTVSSLPKPPGQGIMTMLQEYPHDSALSPLIQRHEAVEGRPAPESPSRRKRRRLSSGQEGADDSEEGATTKRGRLGGRSQDDTDDETRDPETRSKRLSGKGKTPGSPGHRRRSSPGGKKAARENLTEEQKRSNHIQSEQKRRNLIKMGFEDTNRMVPELRAGGFSKSNMLQEAAKFMRELKDGNNRMASILGMIDNG